MRLYFARYPLVLALPLLIASACSSSSTDDDDVGDTETSSASESESGSETSTDTTETSTDTTSDTTDTTSDTTSDTTDTTESTDTTDTGGEFTLTSPVLVEGGAIPIEISCYGDNTSPQLDWVDAPVDALSFAVFFQDLSIDFSHAAIFDIPADATGLPADVDKSAMPADVPGATQPRSYANTFGYAGPCPGSQHTYEFTVYAIDVANLVEIDQNSSLAEVRAALESHMLASATLSGDFTPP